MNTKKIIYQLALRTFTPEGTIAAASKLLLHIASLGADIVYLCPFYTQDNDADKTTWSKRQIASNTNNPKNPYKIADYFSVDEEYGTSDDLKAFVEEAHRCGLLVMFDLVYLHCGRNAVFIGEHPDFVECSADGSVKVGEQWPFARLNFESKELRNYLLCNMETLITKYNADGFRCDVGDGVPLDFWRDSFGHLKLLKPGLITLNEGVNPKYIEETFDMGYSFGWTSLMIEIFSGETPASKLKEFYISERAEYGDNVKKLIRTIDTHDTASDCGLNRNEIIMTSRGVEAALVVTNTFEGVPFLWNGYEVCDDAENNMFSNRDYGRRSAINWSKGFTEDGVRRMKFIKKMHRLYHNCDVIADGNLKWVDNNSPDEIISYIKISENKSVIVFVNGKNKTVKSDFNYKTEDVYIESGVTIAGGKITMEPYGYIAALTKGEL